MRRLRVTGLVRHANRVRRVLSRPITPAERDALAAELRSSLHALDQILARAGAAKAQLSPQSRRAYEFLKGVDLNAVPVVQGGAPAPRRSESVSFRGLRTYFEGLLDDIAAQAASETLHEGLMRGVICKTRDRLNHVIGTECLGPEQLSTQTRELLGWFRHFAEEPAFAAYVDAVRRAQREFAEPAGRGQWTLPLLVHFRPSRHLYRWQIGPSGTRVILNTPGLAFTDDVLRCLARQMCGGERQRHLVTEAMLGDAYQCLVLELEAAGGVVELTRGIACDLADVFERVNRMYFAGTMARPRLTWNRMLTGRKYGHYDFIRDTVMISSSLDHPAVPMYVVDHVMHHELLHKKHGLRWQGDRQHAHTPEFRVEERTFAQYHEADEFLRKLSRRPA